MDKSMLSVNKPRFDVNEETDASYQNILDSWASWYDNLQVEDILPTAYISRHAEEFEIYNKFISKDVNILEADCGLGNQAIFLKRKGFKVYGIGYAQDALKKVKTFDSSLNLSTADIHDLPFKDGSIGAYLSFGVLEHFPFGPIPALKEANRVLAKDGIIVVSMPSNFLLAKIVSGQAKNFCSKLKNNRIIRKIFRKLESQNPIFAYSYSRNEVVNFLKETGFSILKVKPTGHDFIWYTLLPFFRKNKLAISKPICIKFVKFIRIFFPWKTSFYTFAVARKIKDIKGT